MFYVATLFWCKICFLWGVPKVIEEPWETQSFWNQILLWRWGIIWLPNFYTIFIHFQNKMMWRSQAYYGKILVDLHLAFRPFSFFLDNLDTKHSEHFTTRIIFYLILGVLNFNIFQHLSTYVSSRFFKPPVSSIVHRPASKASFPGWAPVPGPRPTCPSARWSPEPTRASAWPRPWHWLRRAGRCCPCADRHRSCAKPWRPRDWRLEMSGHDYSVYLIIIFL